MSLIQETYYIINNILYFAVSFLIKNSNLKPFIINENIAVRIFYYSYINILFI